MNNSKAKLIPWVLWCATLVVAIAGMILIPAVHNMTFFIALLGLLTSFVLTAIAMRRDPSARSQLLGMPILRMAVGSLFVQLVVCFLLMYFADRCHYIIAVVL